MEESDTEDVASHGCPESCGGSRKGANEALTGVRVGRVMSREIQSRVPTAYAGTEGNTGRCVKRECRSDPARSKTPGMHGTSTRENREILRGPAGDGGQAAPGRLRPDAGDEG